MPVAQCQATGFSGYGIVAPICSGGDGQMASVGTGQMDSSRTGQLVSRGGKPTDQRDRQAVSQVGAE